MSAVLTARGNAFLSPPPALAALRHTAAQASAVDSIGHPRRALHQAQPLQLPRTVADRKHALHAEPLSAALTAVSSGLNAFSPLSVAVVYFTGVLSGWMLAKIAFAFFWARKHARYLS